MLWECAYPEKKGEKETGYWKGLYRKLKWNWAIIGYVYAHNKMYMRIKSGFWPRFCVCRFLSSIHGLSLSTRICDTSLLFFYRCETKDLLHSHYLSSMILNYYSFIQMLCNPVSKKCLFAEIIFRQMCKNLFHTRFSFSCWNSISEELLGSQR